jgi:glycosyltransferase involved in cell wall biosynthesis
MRFTVITPCLNRENFIAEAIESVLAQQYDEIEHWIIDGGSTDKTLDIVRAYPHLRVLSEPDRGVYDAFNKGLDRATGDAVIFLNSDDLLTPGTLALGQQIFQNALGTQVISGGCEIFRRTDTGREIEMHCYDDPRQNQLNFRNVTLGFPNINARIFRRSVFDKLGRFNLAYPMASDRDLLLRAALANIPDAPVADILYRYRWHEGSLTMNAGNSSMSQAQRDGLNIIASLLADPMITRDQRRILGQWRRECVAIDVMIQVLNRNLGRAVAIFAERFRQESLLPFTLLRLGSLAVGRRVRTYYHLFRAEHGA